MTMKAILTALEEGRLIELPDADKKNALTLLASLIEAVPSVKANSKVVENVLAREAQMVTYMGKGWACPHARTSDEGELICAVGWRPAGIQYGADDDQIARIVVVYYVPDAQRNAYLKELSMLARRLQAPMAADAARLGDLNAVRHYLLDIVTEAGKSTEQEARARMIRLEARAADVPPAPHMAPFLDPSALIPAWVIVDSAGKIMALAQDVAMVKELEAMEGLGIRLTKDAIVQANGYYVYVRQTSTFGLGRRMLDCMVVKAAPAKTAQKLIQ